MKIETIKKLNQHHSDKQKKYNTGDREGTFYVESSEASNRIAEIQSNNALMSSINLIPTHLERDPTIGLGAGKLIASRTDTLHGGTRSPREIKPESSMMYECNQVNFDIALSMSTLDAFAHYGDFPDRVEAELNRHASFDLTRIGFFGKAASDNSDPDTNPNGEDVAKGWIQALRDNRPESMLSSESKVIHIGVDGDYQSVNDAVCAVKKKIAARHRDVNDLVVLLGSDLVEHDKATFYPSEGSPQAEMRQIKESYGAMPAFMPSCFPARGIFVTSLDNLSIYFLDSAFRRSFGKTNSEKNRIEYLESMSLAYAVEQLDKAASIEFEQVTLDGDEPPIAP